MGISKSSVSDIYRISASSRLPFNSHDPSPREVEFDDAHWISASSFHPTLACAVLTQPGRLQFLADSRDKTQTPQRDVSGDLVKP
eukprot:3466289-Prymnesium_polylepis.1